MEIETKRGNTEIEAEDGEMESESKSKRVKTATIGDGQGNLPEDLLIELLARLPVKSLLRFRGVSKYWYSLIKTRDVLRMHFGNPKNHTRLLALHYTSDTILNFPLEDGEEPQHPMALAKFIDETLTVSPPVHEDIIDFTRRDPVLHQINIIGPIDGLFLLHTGFEETDDRLALWNPARVELKLLPKPEFRFPMDLPRAHIFGFGFDPLTKDYKVVWNPTFWRGSDPDLAAVALYTLGTKSWKQIENRNVLASVPGIWWRCTGPFEDKELFSGACLNGSLYWLVECNCRQQIVLFDMGTDVFREVPAPHNVNAKSEGHNRLVQNEDSIGLLEMEYMPEDENSTILKSIHVWIMKSEGSWQKQFTLDQDTMVQIRYPLGFWKKNEELFVETTNNELVLYNHDTMGIKYLGVHGNEEANFLRVFKYRESLVSVRGRRAVKWNEVELRDIIRNFLNTPDGDELMVEEEEEEEVVVEEEMAIND